MRVFLTACDSRLGVNPMVQRLFGIPEFERVGIHDRPDVIFLSFIAAPQDFQFDVETFRAVLNSRLPVIVFDHSETFSRNYMLGVSELKLPNPYLDLHRELVPSKVKAYFKRELCSSPFNLTASAFFIVHPLDWVLATSSTPPAETREQYEARPIDIFMSWGYSSESRPRMMGELLKQAGRFGAHFCFTEDDLDRALLEGRQRIFALLHTPHYRRIHISKLMEWQGKSKVSISLKGAGFKCFRHAEAPHNSVMACQDPNLVVWSYPWVRDENCIPLSTSGDYEVIPEAAVQQLYEYLRIHQGDLYPIYLKGIANNVNYHVENYSRNYLLPRIVEALK
jgi:hypothetical protein